MAFTSQDDDLGLLDCPVCLESLLEQDPKVLSCGHSFCVSCLINLVDRNNIICPTCRSNTPATKPDVSKLPTNYAVQCLPELLVKLDQMCQVCLRENARRAASCVCLDCCVRFCDKCAVIHNDNLLFEKHRVTNYSSKTSCLRHSEQIMFVCATCCKQMCLFCVLSHPCHRDEIVDLSSFIRSARATMGEAKKSLKKFMSKLDCSVRMLEDDLLLVEIAKGKFSKTAEEIDYQINFETINTNVTELQDRHLALNEKRNHILEVMRELDEMEVMAEWDMEATEKAKTQKELSELLIFETWKLIHQTYNKVVLVDSEFVMETCIPRPVLNGILRGRIDGNKWLEVDLEEDLMFYHPSQIQ